MHQALAVLLLGVAVGKSYQRNSVPESTSTTAMFRVGTKLVEVEVVARTKRGPVAGLTKDQFTLLDNGKPQAIAIFSVKSVRGRVAGRPAQTSTLLPPGVVSNRPNPDEDPPATHTVLILDRLFTQPIDQAYAVARIRMFLNHRRKRDGIGIYALGPRLQVLQDVTTNDALLRRAAERLQRSKPYTRDLDTTGMRGHAAEEYLSYQERVPQKALKQTFEAVARHLANVPGRKNLVWITEAFPLQTPLDDFTEDMQETAGVLNDANVALHAVDARGLIGALDGMTGIPNAEFRGAALRQPMRGRGPAPIGPSHIETMNLLAGLTGGTVSFNDNGLDDLFEKAVEDGDITYSLGFYPSEEAQDGRVHKLSVQIARAGVTLRYRRNYFAPKPQTEAEHRPKFIDLLRDPLDATQIGLIAKATPDPARPGFFDVQLNVDLHDVQLENQDGKLVGSVEVSFHVENSKSVQVLTPKIEFPEDQIAGALEKGLEITHEVQWPEKAGDLRIAVEDKASGAAGSLRIIQ